MVTKRNSAGQQQPYVPAGHGDASGEYGETAYGSNKHYASPDDVRRQLGYTPPEEKKTQETPKELENKLNGKEEQKQVETIPSEMKSKEYTEKNLVRAGGSVKITRGSLSDDEIGILNSYIQKMYDSNPDMTKFDSIIVNNGAKSSKGGYVTYTGNELYINAGWLDEKPSERVNKNNLAFIQDKIKFLKENPTSTSAETLKNLENMRERFEKNINTPRAQRVNVYNAVDKVDGRDKRLQNLLNHELMHKRVHNKIGWLTGHYPDLGEKIETLRKEIRQVYNKAIANGDAYGISRYATTSADEFMSEAYAQIQSGIETPDYIKAVVNKLLDADVKK